MHIMHIIYILITIFRSLSLIQCSFNIIHMLNEMMTLTVAWIHRIIYSVVSKTSLVKKNNRSGISVQAGGVRQAIYLRCHNQSLTLLKKPNQSKLHNKPHNDISYTDWHIKTCTTASCWRISMVISLRRKACHLSQLLSAPLSSVYAQPASDTHGGCTSQTALGNEGSAPSLLLRRIPGKTGTERKGRCSNTANLQMSVHCIALHAVWVAA